MCLKTRAKAVRSLVSLSLSPLSPPSFCVFGQNTNQAALARRELHRLLEDQELASTPLLVLANKVDLEPHMSEDQVIRELNLDYVTANPWILIPISALKVRLHVSCTPSSHISSVQLEGERRGSNPNNTAPHIVYVYAEECQCV